MKEADDEVVVLLKLVDGRLMVSDDEASKVFMLIGPYMRPLIAPWVAGASLRIMYPRTTDREVRRVEGLAEALRATAASVIVEEVAPSDRGPQSGDA